MSVTQGTGDTGDSASLSTATLMDVVAFSADCVHASRKFVEQEVASEASTRAANDDSITAAVQRVDTRLTAHAADSTHITAAERAAWNAKAPLENGKIPASVLPSFVDDVLEYASKGSFPGTGEESKIYVALDTNLTYRWSGSAYVEISPSLALGETASTAYRGDKGKANADAIAAEVSRAEAAEAVNASAIADETARAKASEGGKADAADLATHIGDAVAHVTAAERTAWNAKQDALTDDQKAVVNGGPYLPTSGGYIFNNSSGTTSLDIGRVDKSVAAVNLHSSDVDGAYIELHGGGDESVKPSVIVGDSDCGGSIKKGGKEVATEELVNGLAKYPMQTITDGAMLDRTVNWSASGDEFTFPDATDGVARDFVLAIAAASEAPSVSFPSTGYTYYSDDDDVFTATADAVNVWYFSELSTGAFMVAHKALTAKTQS